MNQVELVNKFDYLKEICKQNGIEIFVSGKEIIIQKQSVLHRADTVDECYGFVFGYIKALKLSN